MRSLGVLCFLLYYISVVHAGEYLLGAGDRVEIAVYNEPDLQVNVKIGKSGFISFPFLDDVQVIGLSTEEVEEKIRSGLLGDYLVDPQVSVSISAYRPFFIHGQVMRPGGYPYQDGLRLDKAIALAGGLSNRASASDWKVTRIVDGKTMTIKVDIATQVKPDDIIKIEQSFF